MKIAFLIDSDSVFYTQNFIKIIREISNKDKLKIDFLVELKRCNFYDFIFSFTSKYEDKLKEKSYKVYPLYKDEEIQEFLNNDLFYYNEYYDSYEYDELFIHEKSVIRKIIKDFKEKNKEYFYSCQMLENFENDDKNDFVCLQGDLPIIVSAPHNVSQYFGGIYKVSDYGTGKLAFSVMENSKCHCIIKTKNIGSVFKNDNANKQSRCPYKSAIKEMVNDYKIKAIVDIHALKKSRKEQINLGIDGGCNLFNNKEYINDIINIIKNSGFEVSLDEPFRGGGNTISGYSNKKLGIYSLQVEINSKFINYNYKTSRYNDLVKMISQIVYYLDKNIKK